MMGLYSYMSKNVYCILNRLEINMCDISFRPLSWLKNKCVPKVTVDWKVNIIKELLLCREGSLDCPLNSEELNDVLHTLCTE